MYVLGTNTAAGLRTTTAMIRNQGRHEDGVPVVVIFLTDGRSNSLSQTRAEANKLHATLPQVKMSPDVVMRARYINFAASHKDRELSRLALWSKIQRN